MNANIFTADLGDLPLTDEQRRRINKAIQQAVTNELATLDMGEKLVFIPVDRWEPGAPGFPGLPNGPLINGIIIDRLSSARIKNLLQA